LLKKIRFKVLVHSDNIDRTDMDKVLCMAAAISPVWLAIRNNVEVETEYEILT
jgi:organic hydroperoxide reductase OsmC/OhrA